MKRSTLLSILAVLALGAAVFVMRQWNQGANRDAAEEMEIDEPSLSPGTGREASGASAVSPASTPAREPASAPPSSPSSAPLEDPLQDEQESAIASLQSTSKVRWDVRHDDVTRSIRTLALGRRAMSVRDGSSANEADGNNARKAADQFVAEFSQPLFGVAKDQLLFTETVVSDRTRVTYRQVVAGTEVYGATLNLFYEDGELTRVQNDLSSLRIASAKPAAGLSQAFDAYRRLDVSVTSELNTATSSRVVLYPSSRSLVYAYEFSVREVSPGSGEASASRVLYNTEDGTLIRRWSSTLH